VSPLQQVGGVDRGLSSLELSRMVLYAIGLGTEWTCSTKVLQQ
jgi:hypothetical protein